MRWRNKTRTLREYDTKFDSLKLMFNPSYNWMEALIMEALMGPLTMEQREPLMMALP